MNYKQFDIIQINQYHYPGQKKFLNQDLVLLSKIEQRNGNHIYAACPLDSRVFNALPKDSENHQWDECCFEGYERGNKYSSPFTEDDWCVIFENEIING